MIVPDFAETPAFPFLAFWGWGRLTSMKIAVGSDHAGFGLKEIIRDFLRQWGLQVEDLGTRSTDSVDYPDYAEKVGGMVRDGQADRGILVCGTGLGMCIAANKIEGIRAIQATDSEMARISRQHNDSNVLCLAGRFTAPEVARGIVKAWLDTPFEGGRHQRRVEKITRLESRPVEKKS